MKIAIANIHRAPAIYGTKFHNYIVELVRQGFVAALYFDSLSLTDPALVQIRKQYNAESLGLNKVDLIFSGDELNHTCDVLLSFDSSPRSFTESVKNFKGLKIFHVMDYFWFEPASVKAARFKEYGIDYMMSYGSPDLYDPFFKKYFLDYIGKVIPLPFGFADRFINEKTFEKRLHKCVAVGSVRPIRFDKEDSSNFREMATFYPHEQWFHKFRRLLVEQKQNLASVMDSMLPEFPRYKDYDFDMVKKFNEYQMFVSDESICYFPSAKAFEGPATGCVMVASDHPCFADFGFKGGENYIAHRQFDVAHFKKVTEDALADQKRLAEISKRGEIFVRNEYSHGAIARKLALIIQTLYNDRHTGAAQKNLPSYCYEILKNPILPQDEAELRSISSKETKTTTGKIIYTYLGLPYVAIAEACILTSRAWRKISPMKK